MPEPPGARLTLTLLKHILKWLRTVGERLQKAQELCVRWLFKPETRVETSLGPAKCS